MGWQAIDAAEQAAGEPHGRPRVKFCRVARDGRGLAPGRWRRLMAADLAELAAMIEAALPGAEVEVVDEGGGDHLRAIVAAPQFDGHHADRPAPARPRRRQAAFRRRRDPRALDPDHRPRLEQPASLL